MPLAVVRPSPSASGVATVNGGNNGVMALYKAETATIHVTDGSISSSGGGDLSVDGKPEHGSEVYHQRQ